MPKADPDAKPTPAPQPAQRPASKVAHEEAAGQIDWTPRAPVAMRVWVDDAEALIGGKRRADLVGEAIARWNEAFGYNAVERVERPEDATVRVVTGEGTSRMEAPGGLEGGPLAEGQIVMNEKQVDPQAWSRVLMHELGHKFGLGHTGTRVPAKAENTVMQNWWQGNISHEEAVKGWYRVANDVYGIPLSIDAIKDVLAGGAGRELTEDFAGEGRGEKIEEMFREWAAKIYEPFASQIKAGVPPRALLDPYLQYAQQILGRPVRLTDEAMTRALLLTDETSPAGLPSLPAFLSRLRGSNEWDDSPEASEMVSQLIGGLGTVPDGVS